MIIHKKYIYREILFNRISHSRPNKYLYSEVIRIMPSSLAVSNAQQKDAEYSLSKSDQGDENMSSGNITVDRDQIVALISEIGKLWLQKKNEIQISEQILIIFYWNIIV